MPRPHSLRPRHTGGDQSGQFTNIVEQSERLRRTAALVATGELSLPSDLAPAELAIVLTHVAQLRRARFINFIAEAIAHDIVRSRGALQEDSCAETHD